MTESSSLDRFTSLIDSAAGVVGEMDLDRVLRRLVTEARSATGARYAALGIIGEHGVLSDFLHEGIDDELATRIGHLPTGRGVLGTVIRLNKTIRLDRISDHPDAYGFPEHHPLMSNFVGVPVAVGDEAFGNLYLTEKEGGFTDQDVTVLEALSRIAGAAVRTARLQERLRRVAVVEDRQRIARELHDSVIQELFAVGLGLQGISQLIDDSTAAGTLNDAVDRLDRAVEALRRYIFQLREQPSDSPRLNARLQELVTRMGSAYPANVTLQMGIEDTGNDFLDAEVIKIVTEALSNSLRHSGAVTVEVEIGAIDSDYVVSVRDNGQGFDPEAPVGGMGLANLRTRVSRLGGILTVTSSLDEGTVVVVRIPIN